MTVENTNNTISYTGNGSVDTFAYNFLTYSADHIFVYLNDEPQNSGFNITGVGDDNGGDVVFNVAPSLGTVVRIDRTVPETQLIEYQEYGPFPAKTNERGLDLLTMAVQQNFREITRAAGGSTISEDPPESPRNGQSWKRCSDLKNFIWYVDQDGGQWVEDRPSYSEGGTSSVIVSEDPPLQPNDGDKWKRCTDLKEFTYYVDQDGGQWVEDRPSYAVGGGSGGAVDSVNGQTGVVVLSKSDVGLSEVDNTTDLNKPISTATQTALDDKIETVLTDGVSVFGDGVNTPLSASGSGGGAVDSVNGQVGIVTLDTDDISDSGATSKYTTAADITKLAGVEDNATANSTDATLLNRANHTGTQTASTISDFESTVSANADVSANTAKVSFPEAPNDGKQYARKDLGWEEVTGGGGGGSSFTVTTFTGGGEMVLSTVNELQDGDTGYTLPAASSGSSNEYLIITQCLEFASFQPVVTCSGSDTITDESGSDTSIALLQSGSVDIRLTTNGVDQWRLSV